MVHFNPNEWVILALVLVLGWLLGLMSRSGAGRWKRAYNEEVAARRAAEVDHEARIAAADSRIAELERTTPAFTAATVGTIGTAARGDHDDLTLIRGIDRTLALRLKDAGHYGFRDIARLGSADQSALEERLSLPTGRIAQDQWVEQAAILARGDAEEHRATYR